MPRINAQKIASLTSSKSHAARYKAGIVADLTPGLPYDEVSESLGIDDSTIPERIVGKNNAKGTSAEAALWIDGHCCIGRGAPHQGDSRHEIRPSPLR